MKILDVSKLNLVADVPLTGWDNEIVVMSCLMRIAAATEAMATNHNAMIRDLEFHKKKCQRLETEVNSLKRSLVATKGHLTRKKRKQTP